MKKKAETQQTCVCGSTLTYEQCCGKYHSGGEIPQTAEQLMRSRYSAYVLGNESWLKKTWASETCPDGMLCDASIGWLGLKIIKAEQVDATHAIVEFVARGRYRNQGAFRLCEVSRFEKRDGFWVYVDGEVTEK